MRVQEAIEVYLSARKRLAPSTRAWYRDMFKPLVAWCEEQGIDDISKVKPPEIRRYQEHRESYVNPRSGKPLSSRSLHHCAVTIKTFLKFCHQEELISSDPGMRIEVPKAEKKVIKILSTGHIDALLAAASKEATPALVQRDRAIISVLIDTGLRASELCGLTLDNVFLNRRDCFIRVMGKGKKEREVGLGKQARAELRSYITRHRKPADKQEAHVFLNHTGEPMTRSGLDHLVHRLRDWAHIRDVRVSPHTFRHTYAINYVVNGGNLFYLMRLLGHNDIATTQGYLEAIDQQQARQGRSVLDTMTSALGADHRLI